MTPDTDRFLDDLKTLRRFGGDTETKGVRRPPFPMPTWRRATGSPRG
jgi:hypothetical protein